MAKKAYGITEISTLMGMTRLGVLYWLERYGLEFYRTASGAVILTEEQLAELIKLRNDRLQQRPGRRAQAELG